MPIRHRTLTANTVTTVSLTTGDWDTAGIYNIGTPAGDLWATVNGADPVAGGDDCYRIPAGARRVIPFATTRRNVKLLSDVALVVEVEFA